MKPTEEEGKKAAVFACETEEDCNGWINILNRVLSGDDLAQEEG